MGKLSPDDEKWIAETIEAAFRLGALEGDGSVTFTARGITFGGVPVGSWEVVVRRMSGDR